MICNEVIKQMDSIKYLGVIIDKKITWSQQVDKIALKANRVRGFLYRNIKHCSLDIKNRCILCYKIFIQLILEYASIIYGPPIMINIYNAIWPALFVMNMALLVLPTP